SGNSGRLLKSAQGRRPRPKHRRMKQNSKIGALCGFSCLLATSSAFAVDRVVATTPQFANALAAASPGDSIILQPGTYGGGHFRAGLQGVTIRSSDPANPAIISGGSNGIQLSDASDVTIADLEF